MNIGIVTVWFERGAAYVSRQYKELLEPEHDVFIYARGGENYARGNAAWDLPCVTWGKKSNWDVFTGIDREDFISWIRKNKIEVIFFNEQHFFLPVLLCKELGLKTGAYVDYYTETTRPLFAIYDFLICNTKLHCSAFAWHEGMHYVSWGTDIDLYTYVEKKQRRDEKIIFFHSAGMSQSRKGTLDVIRAFHSMAHDHSRLLIHTQRPLIFDCEEIADITNRLIESNSLEIIEKTVGCPGLYALGDVYVYPSKLDGIGLTIAEALSSGLPVIVPDVPPMNEFIGNDNGKTVLSVYLYAREDGYFWPQNCINCKSLADAMQYYDEHWEEIDFFQKRARAYAVENLNWRDRKKQILKIFQSASGKPLSMDLKNKIMNFEKNRLYGDAVDWFSHNCFLRPFLRRVFRYLQRKI